MKILISGGSGFLGSFLKKSLENFGYQCSFLVRREPIAQNEFIFNPQKRIVDLRAFEKCDLLLNLSGESIFGYWTPSKKARIEESRIATTSFLSNIIIERGFNFDFFSASAIGYYGYEERGIVTENDESSSGFLANLCKKWEEEANKASKICRVVNMRFGVILGKSGGLLKKVLPFFKCGCGIRFGDKKRAFSWIAIKEIPYIIDFLSKNKTISGPINFTAPNIISNGEFVRILNKALKKWNPLFIPSPLVRLFLGEMGKELILSGLRVYPEKLIKNGYLFRYTNIEEFLVEELKS